MREWSEEVFRLYPKGRHQPGHINRQRGSSRGEGQTDFIRCEKKVLCVGVRHRNEAPRVDEAEIDPKMHLFAEISRPISSIKWRYPARVRCGRWTSSSSCFREQRARRRVCWLGGVQGVNPEKIRFFYRLWKTIKNRKWVFLAKFFFVDENKKKKHFEG